MVLGRRALHCFAFFSQFGRTSAPMIPHFVHTIFGPNQGTVIGLVGGQSEACPPSSYPRGHGAPLPTLMIGSMESIHELETRLISYPHCKEEPARRAGGAAEMWLSAHNVSDNSASHRILILQP
jgi:hypothetical protein